MTEELTRRLYDLCQGKSYDQVKAELAALVAPPQPVAATVVASHHVVAVLGLGAMGKGIAQCLVAKGHTVRAWNRSDVAGKTQATVAEAVSGASVVFSMLADDRAVRSVAHGGLLDHLAPGAVHCSLSTISVSLARELAAAHEARGQRFVSCPVFGRPDAASRGMLFGLPGGTEAAVAAATPLLRCFTQRMFPFASPEQASLAKLCGNFLIISTVESLGEAMCLAEKGGISNRQLLDLLLGTLFNSPLVARYGGIMVDRQFSPAGFQMPLGLKDVRLALEAGDELRAPMPLGSLVRDRLLQTLAQPDSSSLDWSGIFLSIRRDAGLS